MYSDATVTPGCYDGSVSWYDVRVAGGLVAATEFQHSHRMPVYGLKWVGKTGQEFLTGSQVTAILAFHWSIL